MKILDNLISKMGIVGELLRFLWERKLWWLIPMVIMLILFGLLIIVTQATPLAPFIYPLF